MTTPAVRFTEQDNRLGILPPQFGRPFAVVGVAERGSLVPSAYGRSVDVATEYGGGPMPAFARYLLDVWGVIPLCVRTGQTTAGDIGTLVSSMLASTSVPTIATGTQTIDDFEIGVRVKTGGTIGTTGIELEYTVDGGANWSLPVSLGTATHYVVPGTGGARVNFAAGTLVAGATMAWRPTAARWNTAEVEAALESLRVSSQDWEIVFVTGVIDGTAFDAIDGAIANMREKVWIGGARVPNVGETKAQYETAMAAIWNSRSTTRGSIYAGACDLTHAGRRALRSAAWPVAALEATLTEEQNAADTIHGALRNVSIVDANGNPKHHDEDLSPGLDAMRLGCLRTHGDPQGVFVNRPLLLAPSGSDFYIMPLRRVFNKARRTLRATLKPRLNHPIRVNRKTGFIFEEDAAEIESTCNVALESALLSKPQASAVRAVVNRTDNILATKRLRVAARLTPLSYPEDIEVDIAFENPTIILVGPA